jgi:hypothetical protein
VGAGVLPIVADANQSAVYVDCSKVNSLAYFPQNPCQTFVLIRSQRFASSSSLLDAETARLRVAGWRHPTLPPPIDYDVGNATAPVVDSWLAPEHHACAYIATDHAAVTAEGKELIPFDRYDDPHEMLVFYETAKAAAPHEALWVRLRPPTMFDEVPAKPRTQRC